ncbi:uncharacterized protein LOC111636371 [Centruroides sculpturatus]|uniref:uncharacterized protein LOC111636371 n=1 Tax=Centruroides sculpturatus TaxID=218467 RepID=UPI000C6DD329|nr:uncharacterized protein LOC111636371 [Centruroides sculpturatus]
MKDKVLLLLCLLSFTVSINGEIDIDVNDHNYTDPYGVFNVNPDGSVNPGVNWTGKIISHDSVNILIVMEDMLLDVADKFTITNEDDDKPLFNFHDNIAPFSVLIKAKQIKITVNTSNSKVRRTFRGYYNMEECKYVIEKDSGFMSTPLYGTTANCSFILSPSQTYYSKRSITFLNALSNQKIYISGSGSQDSAYSGNENVSEIIGKDTDANLTLTIEVNKTKTQKLFFAYENVQNGSEFINLRGNQTVKDLVYNSSEVSSFQEQPSEIHWIIESEEKTVISLQFMNLSLTNGAQILVSDGNSKLAQPIRQISSLDYNKLEGTYILSTGTFLRIALTPFNGKIVVNAQVRSHDQGGYFQNKGELHFSKSKEDIIYLLEVNENENVVLESQNGNPLTVPLYVYNDFSVSSKLLFTLKGDIPNYPIVSDTSKMMIIAKNFNDTATYKANFKGIPKGCYRMTSQPSYDYVISGNCQQECKWTTLPDNNYETISLHMHLLNFDAKDILTISLLDKDNTKVLDIRTKETIPELYLPAKVGFVMTTKNVNCNASNSLLHVNYEKLNGCDKKIEQLSPGQMLQITSPNYPNTYPLLAECWSNFTSNNSSKRLYHVAFDRLSLSSTHCLTFWEDIKAKNATMKTFSGVSSPLPDDLLFQPDLAIEFISKPCNATKNVNLDTAQGFALNVTSADCGGTITAKDGNFSTPNKTTSSYCIWQLEVPESGDVNHPNIINFTVKSDNKDNHLKIYDGGSVRDMTKEVSSKEMLSRTNKLIFVYNRTGLPPTDNLVVKFHSQTCNMTCQNKMCLHAAWVCNNINECGDNTDELNCTGRPIPPEPPSTPAPAPSHEGGGVSPVALGLGLPIAFICGILAALFVPPLYRRFRSSQYHQFRDISAEA